MIKHYRNKKVSPQNYQFENYTRSLEVLKNQTRYKILFYFEVEYHWPVFGYCKERGRVLWGIGEEFMQESYNHDVINEAQRLLKKYHSLPRNYKPKE